MQFAKQQQRHHRARQRTCGNGNQTQQQGFQGTKHCQDEQDNPKDRDDAQRGDVPFCLLAGVITVKHGTA